MPEPARVTISNQAAQGMVERSDKGGAVEAGEPAGNRRLLFHPGYFHLAAHVQEMDRRPAALLDKSPKGLHVIMMHPPAMNAQPIPFPFLHQVKGDMSVLE